MVTNFSQHATVNCFPCRTFGPVQNVLSIFGPCQMVLDKTEYQGYLTDILDRIKCLLTNYCLPEFSYTYTIYTNRIILCKIFQFFFP